MALPGSGEDRERQKFTEIENNLTAVRTIDGLNAYIIKFDTSDEVPDYIGINEDRSAATTDTDWAIYKFTYNASDDVTQVEKAVGAWDSRAGLFT